MHKAYKNRLSVPGSSNTQKAWNGARGDGMSRYTVVAKIGCTHGVSTGVGVEF